MIDKPAPPVEDDIRYDDEEYNPTLEPKSAKAWLNLLQESEDAFEDYNDHCDKIDKQYANLARLSQMARDKEFQMFWANCEVIKPSIYAKPPIPVVVQKFKDQRPVYQAAAELMERCAVVAFDLADIDELMKLVRDDLALIDRGVAWVRYESGKGGNSYYDHEKVCIDFKNRRDFLHGIARNWREVPWVAAASYLTRAEARERFYEYSGNAYQDAEYKVDKDAKEVGGADNRERAKFWEIWSKGDRRVVWVAHGCEDILDEDEPHLDLRCFFPCPKPAYGTVQRGSLVPVPDVLQYKDQLDELNLLTGRIHALSDALEAKGFYPAGGAEIADAVQTALAIKTPGRVLVPISNWAAFGGSKEVIIWLPIDMIAQTITGLVTLRKQIIEDIYQVMGLSDIMRGATDPNETYGAQQLKTQYGSTRIRDKQQELVRLARDLVEITTEIITEKFKPATMIEMSQTQLPTQQMQQQAIEAIIGKGRQLQMQMQQAQQPPPQLAPPGGAPGAPGASPGAPPEAQAQQLQQLQTQMQELEGELQKVQAKPTIEQVLTFVKNNRAKSFVLDIETDSTIQADENAEKKARTEFVQVLGQLLPQLSQMITAEPKTAKFCGELLKFATAPFRAGRSLDGSIDELVQQMEAKGNLPQRPDPETEKVKALVGVEQQKLKLQAEKDKAELAHKDKELAQKAANDQAKIDADKQVALLQMRAKTDDDAIRANAQNQKAMFDREKHQQDMIKKSTEVDVAREKMQLAQQQSAMKQNDMANRANERQMALQAKVQQGFLPRGGAPR